jgi:hypothetical protein
VIDAPRHRASDPAAAAEIKTGLEHPENTISADQSQWRDLLAERGIRVHPAADKLPMLSDEQLLELGDDIEANQLQHGIVLRHPTKKYPGPEDAKGAELVDGRNRIAAVVFKFRHDPDRLADRLNDLLYVDPPQVGCARIIGSDVDPWDYVLSVNLRRRHLPVEDRKRLAAELLKSKPDRSDRSLAKATGLSDKTIGLLRRDAEGRAEIPHAATRTDTAGRQQPATKPPQVSKEAQLRAMREAHANAQPAPGAAPASDAGRVQNAILNAYLALKAADNADLPAARRALNADQAALALDHIDGARARLRKLEAALRGDG